MFKYVGDISSITHYIVSNFVDEKLIAIDATLGNGYDSDFLSDNFNKVYSFDIQEEAINNYKLKQRENVELILDSHEYIEKYVTMPVNCIMFNLGFLPGGSKEITTLTDSTLKSLEASINILSSGGIITIALYNGHTEGKKESSEVINFARNLDKKFFGVMHHKYLNRTNCPPELVVIEKK
ncbi:class I SAM-dependent methyltransferase [Clostridium sp. YIM B02505]|uniref:Class I SAM-dependent methyltransferase n=1 Tax=Clostridium yunnanense TaxID=2800325 RepID=A0ABS1EL99_9CLOT|nr:class I SAM-dependent methyltransferase [Clostridium yunnanense]MBK1810132.1 class I SAM-dependent methyltransferase [Clostridium yunnanense]